MSLPSSVMGGRTRRTMLRWAPSHDDVGGVREALQAARVQRVERAGALATHSDKSHRGQGSEVVAHGGLPDRQHSGQLPDRHSLRLGSKPGDELHPGGIGQGTEPLCVLLSRLTGEQPACDGSIHRSATIIDGSSSVKLHHQAAVPIDEPASGRPPRVHARTPGNPAAGSATGHWSRVALVRRCARVSPAVGTTRRPPARCPVTASPGRLRQPG